MSEQGEKVDVEAMLQGNLEAYERLAAENMRLKIELEAARWKLERSYEQRDKYVKALEAAREREKVREKWCARILYDLPYDKAKRWARDLDASLAASPSTEPSDD